MQMTGLKTKGSGVPKITSGLAVHLRSKNVGC